MIFECNMPISNLCICGLLIHGLYKGHLYEIHIWLKSLTCMVFNWKFFHHVFLFIFCVYIPSNSICMSSLLLVALATCSVSSGVLFEETGKKPKGK